MHHHICLYANDIVDLPETCHQGGQEVEADRFVAIVTDNAANMVAMHENALHVFKHMVKFR